MDSKCFLQKLLELLQKLPQTREEIVQSYSFTYIEEGGQGTSERRLPQSTIHMPISMKEEHISLEYLFRVNYNKSIPEPNIVKFDENPVKNVCSTQKIMKVSEIIFITIGDSFLNPSTHQAQNINPNISFPTVLSVPDALPVSYT